VVEVANWLKDLGFTTVTLRERAEKENLEPDPRKWTEADLKAWGEIAAGQQDEDDRARQGR